MAHPVLQTLSIIRDPSIKSAASSALHLESSSCGNAQGGNKNLEKVHQHGTAIPADGLLAVSASALQSLCVGWFFLFIPDLQASSTTVK